MLTVIVIVYNRRQFLRQAILSLLAEKLRDIQILVVDDGSTDGSLATVADLPIDTIRFAQNRGPAVARNAALRGARGELIAFLDSDDLLVPGGLIWRVDWLQANPHEMGVIGKMESLINEKGEVDDRDFLGKIGNSYRELPERFSWSLIKKDGFHLASCLSPGMFRKVLLDKVGWFEEWLRIVDDYDFVLRLLKISEIPVVRRPVFRYRLHDTNISVTIQDGQFAPPPRAFAEHLLVQKSHGLCHLAPRTRVQKELGF